MYIYTIYTYIYMYAYIYTCIHIYTYIYIYIELILMPTLSYQLITFIQQILCRENDVIFLCNYAFF